MCILSVSYLFLPPHIAKRCYILKLKHLLKLIKTAKALILNKLRKFKVYIAKILR